jgi:hypothetical protein
MFLGFNVHYVGHRLSLINIDEFLAMIFIISAGLFLGCIHVFDELGSSILMFNRKKKKHQILC